MALTDVKSEQIQSSVALAGSPTTTTQSASDNSTKIATTAYVETAVANLVASAPAALNTLDELAAALNDDASFSTTVTNSIATKLPLAGGTLTGALVGTTATFAGGSANNNDDANILTLNASQHARLLVDTSSTSGHRATLALESNGNELTLSNTGSASYLTSVGNLEISGGNVGIGASSPSVKLHVRGSAVSGATFNADDGLTIEQAGGGGSNINLISSTNTGVLFSDAAARAVGLINYSHSDDSMRFNTNGSERVRIDSSGKVGIGTSSPTGLLHLSSGSPALYITDTTNNADGVISVDNNGSLVFNADLNSEASNTSIRFLLDGSEAMRIDDSGNVGIGTSNPGYKLTVSGESSLGDFSANGFANLGRNADGNQDVTTLGGYGVLSSGTRYGRYGVLRFRSSANYTSSSRGYMITNGYGANKFAILQSNSATTMPNIASAGGGASDGDPVFIIDHAGRTTQPKQPYVQGRGNAGWSATAGSSTWNLQPHGNTPVTSRDHGNNYSTTNKRFTCPVDGVYLVQASWYIYQTAAASYGSQYVHPAVFKNGSSNWNGGHQPYTISGQMMERSGSGSKHYDGLQISFTIYCSANDYLEIYLYSPNSNPQSYENYHYFSYMLLS